MSSFGDGMRCADQIRADGVTPVPVPDACQQALSGVLLRNRQAENLRPFFVFLAPRSGAGHQAKNVRGLGQGPRVFAARSAAGLFS